MAKPKMPQQTISVVVGGQCCGHGYDADELEAIGLVFLRGASAARNLEYGEVTCRTKNIELMGDVAIEYSDREFDEKNGLPLIERIEVRKRGNTH